MPGTPVAGYVQTDIPRECQKCEYFRDGRLCNEEHMLKNTKVATDKESGFKIVHPVMGCCDYWNPGDGVNLMQAPPPATPAEKFVMMARKGQK